MKKRPDRPVGARDSAHDSLVLRTGGIRSHGGPGGHNGVGGAAATVSRRMRPAGGTHRTMRRDILPDRGWVAPVAPQSPVRRLRLGDDLARAHRADPRLALNRGTWER